MSHTDSLSFDISNTNQRLIKVVGVGGGGSNAVNYMYEKGINNVDFVVCNTDAQALEQSPISSKIHLGESFSEGMGAGGKPKSGEKAAQESVENITNMLSDNTKMVFITAGMGGGTGTGAAPIIAKIAKNIGILTVGIVTSPFRFEGETRRQQAIEGIEKMHKHVDALVVINNNNLLAMYGSLGYRTGFAKADEVLLNAAKGIAEVISNHYTMNIDLNDARTVLADSGYAIMGSATASGADKAQIVAQKAINSPLLENNNIHGAKNVLLLIISGNTEATLDEVGYISEYIQNEAGQDVNIITGIGEDLALGNCIGVTIIATGFEQSNTPNEQQVQLEVEKSSANKIVHHLEDSNTVQDKQVKLNFEDNNSLEIDEIVTKENSSNIDNSSDNDFIINDVTIQKNSKEAYSPFKISFDIPEKHPSLKTESQSEDNDDQTRRYYEENDISSADMEINIINKVSPVATTQQFHPRENTSNPKDNMDEVLKRKYAQQQEHIRNFNLKLQNENNIDMLESQPAFLRQGIDIGIPHTAPKTEISKSNISVDSNNKTQIRTNNSFLHDNVD